MKGNPRARWWRPGAASLLLAWLAVLPGSAWGVQESPAEPEPPTRKLVYALEHRSAGEAAALVFPLLSEDGQIEVLSADNSLVVKDLPGALERIESLLRDFDRPRTRLILDLRVVAAETAAESRPVQQLPQDLVRRLRKLLRYQAYRQLGRARLELVEGEEVRRPVGSEYRVEFRLGALQEDRRVKLLGFRIHRLATSGEPLIHTNLSLWMDQPMILGLARAEESDRALMIVLSCTRSQGEAR